MLHGDSLAHRAVMVPASGGGGKATVELTMLMTTTLDGVDIALHELGAGEARAGAPLLLMAHATGFCAMVLDPLARALGDRWRCAGLDMRGHGDSGPPPGHLGWVGFGEDVRAAARRLGDGPVYGVGHSSGGAALLMAEEAAPGTFRAIYCFEPIVLPPGEMLPGPSESRLASSARRRREVFASREEAYANFSSKPPLSALDPDALAAYVEHGFAATGDGQVRLKCHRETEALVYETRPASQAWTALQRISCPVTIAAGGRSDTMPPAWQQALAKELPRGRVEVLDGLGHFGPMEDPRAVAESVSSSFADAVTGAGSRDHVAPPA